jgi:hypothetical protein
MTVANADALYLALTRVSPRARHVLVARFIAKAEVGDGRSQAAFAAFYGIAEDAARVLLWRAVNEFDAMLTNRAAPTPLAFEEEQRRAKTLCAALEAEQPPTSQELGRTLEALRALQGNAAVIRERLSLAELAELSSPEYARETWLRHIAIIVVVAVAAWFYWPDLVRWFRSAHGVEAGRDAGQ